MEIHPAARENIEREAGAVLSGTAFTSPKPVHRRAYSPDLHVKQTIRDDDIHGEVEKTITDGLGQVVGFEFELDGSQCQIEGDNYAPISAVIDKIADTKGMREKVSPDWIRTRVHRWVRDSKRRRSSEPFFEYIAADLASDVRRHEFWMPIADLHVQHGFKFGKGSIQPIATSLIDRMQQALAERNPDRAAEAPKFVDRFYRRYQGFAAFVVTREVETSLGWKLAFDDAQMAAAMIRLFSGHPMTPDVRSGVAPWGCNRSDSVCGFALSGGFLPSGTEGGRGVDPRPLVWDDAEILLAHQHGLAVISSILERDDRNDYEEALLETLVLYSTGATRSDPADRLTYTLIALERMFLRNDTESITQSLADRIALFTADTVHDRKTLSRVVRSAYSMRSRFVHHGNSIADLNALREFLRRVYVTLILLIGRSRWFKSHVAFLDEIETAKLSGASFSARDERSEPEA